MIKIKEIKTPIWDEDLIMCPSQCYCYFEADGKRYCIYLRWRWDDPWTAKLVPVDNRCEFEYGLDWERIETRFYSHEEYKRLEREIVKTMKKMFKNIKWLHIEEDYDRF